jgi:hypothetical protein
LNANYYTKTNVDTSLNTNYYTKTYVDTSLNTNYYTKTYVDTSLNNIRSQIYDLTNGAPETLDTLSEISNAIKSDASFGIVVYQKIASSDLSINEIRSQINSISITGAIQDPSINSLYLQNTIYDASFLNISNNYYTKTDVDSSLNQIRIDYDSSLNTNYATIESLSSYATTSYTDSSLNQIRIDYDSSLNTNYYTKTFVDNSLNTNYYTKTFVDNSLNTNYYTKTFVDNSLNTNYYTKTFVDNSLNTNYYTKNSIDSSINNVLLNYSQGIKYQVTNSGAGAYLINNNSNPNITLIRGLTYVFSINASGHPFWIQTTDGAYNISNVYNTGITNNGTQNTNITWVIDNTTPNTLYYVCEYHESMKGTINIIDLSFATITNINDSLTSYYTKSAIDSSINTNFYNRSLIDASFALTTYVDTQINSLINSAPTTLNTLSEIATALQSDASFGVNVYARISSSDASINLIRSESALTSYVDNSLNNIRTNYATTASLSSYATTTYTDNSLNNIRTNYATTASLSSYATTTYTDNSLNNIRTNYATTSSLSSYATTTYTDNSLNNIRTKYDASFTSLYSSDTTLNGNLTLGSGSKSIGINKQPSSLYSLDVSGSTKITGNLSLVKNPSDASYSYFDMSSVNMSVFNVSEKFHTMAYNASLALNYALGGIFYITGASNNVTSITITNVPSTLNRSVSFTVMLEQSGTSMWYFSGTQITINGVAITIFTPDKTAFVAPSSARSIVIHQFVILWTTSTPKVLAYMSSQGSA